MASGRVIGVLSGCGGAGASVLAAVLAGCAAEPGGLGAGVTAGAVFLLDCDPMGGGIDVLLGCEQVPGPRWRQVHLRGGTLDPAVLLESLPRWNRVSFLAADSAAELQPDAVDRVIGAASQAGTVVVDLPRWSSPVRAAALERCDRVVLVVPAEVRAVTAGALIAAGLDASKSTVAVRGTCRNLPAQRIGTLLGLPVVGEIPYDPASLRPSGLNMSRLRRGSRRLAEAVLTTGSSGCEAAA